MINIYKASAGSGKTHTLTRDYLFLAFQNHLKFRNILAVTFTNKAAGEMKDRIINELSILSELPHKSAFLYDLKKKFNVKSSFISSNAKIILKKILHNYTFFNISTIDSFVQKVIRAFTFELKIPASYGIELDAQKVSADLTDIILSGLDDNKKLQKWLTSYAFERINQQKKWYFRQNIIDFSMELFNEKFYSFFDETNNSTEEFESKLSDFSSKIYQTINFFEKEIKKNVEKGIEIIKKSGIGSVSINKIKYLRNFFFNNYEKINLEINATLTKAIEEDDFWNKTTKENIKSQWSNTVESLKKLLLDIFEFEKIHGQEYYTAQEIRKNIYSFGVINTLKNELPQYRDEKNIMLIIDLTMMLKKIIGNNEAPFIYEKIGNRYSNIMIDEFQDTSEFQWHNFKPLILNTLATDNYNLIVGDVKQSIYRWRNGDWRLLHSTVKKEIGENFVKETTLDTNWRSKKEIVNFNNAIFLRLSFLLQQKVNEDLANTEISEELLNLLPNAYSDTFQKIAPQNDEGGYVKFQFIPKSQQYKDVIEDEVLKLIEELLQKYSAGDIAVLVRTNSEANSMMKLLLDYSNDLESDKQFNVISAESLLLTNSLAVRIIVDVFRYVINDEDLIFLIEIIANYERLTDLEFRTDFLEVKTISEASEFLPNNFIEIFDNLQHLTLFELLENIISVFKINTFDSEIPFVRSFEEIINGYVQNNGSDLKSFIDFWDEKQDKFSIQLSEVEDAMQVMTLHKSKGLAFRVVIMPFVSWKLDPMTNSIMWGNTQKTNFNDFPYFPISISEKLSKTSFADDYIEEKIYSYMDALNMLYVAFTRAKERLYGFVPIPKKINGRSIGEQIFKALNENHFSSDNNVDLIKLEDFFDNGKNVFELGNQDVIFAKKDEHEQGFNLNSYPAHDWTKNIAIVTHSDDLIAETVETRKIAIKQGILMHEIFSLITNVDDVDFAIETMLENGKITKSDADLFKKNILELLENEQVKSWFDADWNVFAEKEILTKYGDIKIPDRVISNEKEVIVIDYKFGNIRSEHKRQVKRYVQLLKDIEKNKTYKGFLLYADKNEVIEVL